MLNHLKLTCNSEQGKSVFLMKKRVFWTLKMSKAERYRIFNGKN